MSAGGPLALVHFGDLHLTDPWAANHADFLSILSEVARECAPSLDFALLPGDVADGGLPGQYRLAAVALRMLGLPVEAVPGDHDMGPDGLRPFHAVLGAPALPRAVAVRGVRCLFLDMCGAGAGGLDFRLGDAQLAWLAAELGRAAASGERSAVFAHTYPADLRHPGEADALVGLLARHDVPLFDMGHTHYNELGNDGRTVFAAARSTGQAEEGPVGYAVLTLDGDAVGWRFRELGAPFPFVAITSPADHRLVRDGAPAAGGPREARALVLGAAPLERVECRGGEGPWTPMARAPGGRSLWAGAVDLPPVPLAPLEVRALDARGVLGRHRIEVAGPGRVPPRRLARGSDADRVGPWPENGLLGTQLGPNRDGRAW